MQGSYQKLEIQNCWFHVFNGKGKLRTTWLQLVLRDTKLRTAAKAFVFFLLSKEGAKEEIVYKQDADGSSQIYFLKA